jgi:glucose-6-phosphate 1-epimerase
MSEYLQQLNDRFRIPGVAEVVADRGGLPAVWIEGRPSVAHGAAGTVYLHGAHVASWHPYGTAEVLWLSHKSFWQSDKAIRGGVPLCFPWFGPRKDHPQSPAHGFARINPWQIESIDQTDQGIRVSLVLAANAATRAHWPHDFLLRHRITFGDHLIMALELTHPAPPGSPAFSAELAQHTYFSVGDVRQARIAGLSGTRYIDKTDALKEKVQGNEPITITAETDRVYLNTTAPITIEDPVHRRRITISKENSRDTVVWNPWIAKAKAMPDFGDEEWPAMLCIESANVGGNAITLAPGQSQTMTTRINVQSM